MEFRSKILTFCLCLLATFTSLNAQQFPTNVDSIRATIAGSFFPLPSNLEFEEIKFRPRDRKNGKKGKKVKIRFFRGKQNTFVRRKPILTFVLEGIGGTGDGNISNLIAYELSKMGRSAIVVPSVFTKKFAASSSKTGYVGNPVNDSKDLLKNFVKVKALIHKQTGLNFEQVNLIGYSLGALTAAHIGKLVHVNKAAENLNLGTVLLLNPPVDMIHGLRTIDGYADGKGFRFKKIPRYAKLFLKIRKLNKETKFMNLEVFNALVHQLNKIRDSLAKKLVAQSLMSSLGDVVKVSQDAFDLGILPAKGEGSDGLRRYQDQARAKAIRRLSFEDYLSDFFIPFQQRYNNQPNLTLEKLNQISSLTALENYISNSRRVFLIHNEDDFLLRHRDVNYLKSIFRENATFFPNGGHLGNIWHSDYFSKIWEFIEGH